MFPVQNDALAFLQGSSALVAAALERWPAPCEVSVLCAPAGSGKTLSALRQCAARVTRGQRCVYVTTDSKERTDLLLRQLPPCSVGAVPISDLWFFRLPAPGFDPCKALDWVTLFPAVITEIPGYGAHHAVVDAIECLPGYTPGMLPRIHAALVQAAARTGCAVVLLLESPA